MFGCDGFAANVVIIAAAEMAYQDGMDIINLCAAEQTSFRGAHILSMQGQALDHTVLSCAISTYWQKALEAISAGHMPSPHNKRQPEGLSHAVRRSLGSGPTWPTQGPDAVLNEVLANLVYAGLFVAVAAGNAGGTAGFDVPQPELGLCVPASVHHNSRSCLSTFLVLVNLVADMLPDCVTEPCCSSFSTCPRQVNSCLPCSLR